MEYFDARQFINLAGGLGLIDSPELRTFRNGRLAKEPAGWNPSLEDILRFSVEDASLSPALVLCAMYSGLPSEARPNVRTIEMAGRPYRMYSVPDGWEKRLSNLLVERCSGDGRRRGCIESAIEDTSTIPSAADIRKCFYIRRSMMQSSKGSCAGYGTIARRAGRSREAYFRFENWRANRYSYPRIDSLNLYLGCCGEYHPLDFIVDVYFYMDVSDAEVIAIAQENRRRMCKA